MKGITQHAAAELQISPTQDLRCGHESAGKQKDDLGRDIAIVRRKQGWKEWKKARHHPESHNKDVRPVI